MLSTIETSRAPARDDSLRRLFSRTTSMKNVSSTSRYRSSRSRSAWPFSPWLPRWKLTFLSEWALVGDLFLRMDRGRSGLLWSRKAQNLPAESYSPIFSRLLSFVRAARRLELSSGTGSWVAEELLEGRQKVLSELDASSPALTAPRGVSGAGGCRLATGPPLVEWSGRGVAGLRVWAGRSWLSRRVPTTLSNDFLGPPNVTTDDLAVAVVDSTILWLGMWSASSMAAGADSCMDWHWPTVLRLRDCLSCRYRLRGVFLSAGRW